MGIRQPSCAAKTGDRAPAASTTASASNEPADGFDRAGPAIFQCNARNARFLDDFDAARPQHAGQRRHQPIGPQVGIAGVVPAACRSGAQRRFELGELCSIVWPGIDLKFLVHERGNPFVLLRTRAEI